MNPKNWLTGRATFPAGGDPVWQGDNLAGQLLRDEFFGAAPPPPSGGAGYILAWNGSAWVSKPVKVWTGSAWVIKPLKRWDGLAWVTT